MTMRAKWRLSAVAFDLLLDQLAPDREAAGRRYETIRAGLLRFFARRVGSAAESLVDETIDRVCRRVERGDHLERAGAYFHGVARNVLREHLRTERRRDCLHRAAVSEPPEPGASWAHEQGEPERLLCLRRCLHALPEAERALIRDYYGAADEDAATVRSRRAALAESLGISPGNLRVRAFRVRHRLEECFDRCVAGASGRAARQEDPDRG